MLFKINVPFEVEGTDEESALGDLIAALANANDADNVDFFLESITDNDTVEVLDEDNTDDVEDTEDDVEEDGGVDDGTGEDEEPVV